MAKSKVRIRRSNPYKNFTFKVKWDGRYVAGVSKVSALKRTTEVLEFHEAGEPGTRRLPGQIKFDAITLERGITLDREFDAWAVSAAAGAGFRKDITIDVFNAAGKRIVSYQVSRCWVSEYQVLLPDLNAKEKTVAIETLKLENEGWQRVAV